jgi:hypothetical protein
LAAILPGFFTAPGNGGRQRAVTLAATALVLAVLIYWHTSTPTRNEGKAIADKRAPVLVDNGALNDTARFLAGMSVSAGSFLEPLTNNKAFAEHAEFLDRAWDDVEARQLAKVRAWSSDIG